MEQPVSSVMDKSFVTVRKEDSIGKAIDLIVNHRAPFVPVVGDFDVVVGTVTEHDLLKVFHIPVLSGTTVKISEEFMKSGLERSAGDIMTPQPITLGEDAPVSEAVRMLTNNQMHFLPIVNKGGVIVGILRLLDIMKPHAITA